MLQIHSVGKPTERYENKLKQPLSRVHFRDFEQVFAHWVKIFAFTGKLLSNRGADNISGGMC